jgi:hypothetical protein
MIESQSIRGLAVLLLKFSYQTNCGIIKGIKLFIRGLLAWRVKQH